MSLNLMGHYMLCYALLAICEFEQASFLHLDFFILKLLRILSFLLVLKLFSGMILFLISNLFIKLVLFKY